MKPINIFFKIILSANSVDKLIVVSLLLIFTIIPSSFSQTKQESTAQNRKSSYPSNSLSKKYVISGKVTQTFSYCGGAAPPKELLDKLSRPGAFANKKFFIRAGNVNRTAAKIVAEFTTDSNGIFSIKLAAGTYSVILEEQLNKIKAADFKKPNQQVDIKCLEEWWAKPYYLLKVSNKHITNLSFNFQHRCFIDSDIPCIFYKGPLRP